MLDSHCHLNDKAYSEDIDQVIDRAFKNGVKTLLVVGWDIESSKEAITIAHKAEGIYAAVGIHPENIGDLTLDVLKEIRDLAKDEKAVAIGEIGLDHHWIKDAEVWSKQKDFFVAQLRLANELGLPVSIHSRDASGETLEVLKQNHLENGGVLHCYSGPSEMVPEFIGLGLYLGFDGPITFKNSINPKESVQACPINRILTETDSPYLTPAPHRGERNEPSYIVHILEAISNIKGLGKDDVEKAIENNFNELFHVKQ